MITVVCWKWQAFPGYRSKFTAEHVNVFARMIRRHYRGPMEIVCVTDDPEGIDRVQTHVDVTHMATPIGRRELIAARPESGVDRIIPLWPDFAEIPSPHDLPGRPRRNPSCYRRLKMFEADAARWLGTRVISLDLDMVVTGDLTALFERPEEIVLWGDTNPTTFYNGGMILHTPGTRTCLWEEFRADPKAAIRKAQKARQWGSDQGWIGARLGPDEARFSNRDGVYSYRMDLRPRRSDLLPPQARIVFFHGEFDPWGEEAQGLAWVRENWR